MRGHRGIPPRHDKHVTLAAISTPGVARGRFVGGHQSGVAGSKSPPLFTRGASSCPSQKRRQGEPWGASPRPSAPTYLPTSVSFIYAHHGSLWTFVFKLPPILSVPIWPISAYSKFGVEHIAQIFSVHVLTL